MTRLSWTWRAVLTKLADYGEMGIDRDAFIELMGDKAAAAAVAQMGWGDTKYIEAHPPGSNRIRITENGNEALLQ